MANRKMRCNKTKMKMMRLVGEVLEKKMPSKYQEFQMLGIKDTEYSQLGRYGHYELEFYLGDDCTTCMLDVFSQEPFLRFMSGQEFMGNRYKHDEVFILEQGYLEGLGILEAKEPLETAGRHKIFTSPLNAPRGIPRPPVSAVAAKAGGGLCRASVAWHKFHFKSFPFRV